MTAIRIKLGMREPAKLRDFTDTNYKELHDIVFPADVRKTDQINARIRASGTETDYEPVRVWKLSPLGIEIINEPSFDHRKSDKVDLQLVVGNQTTTFEGLIVDLVEGTGHPPIIGIRFSKKQIDQTPHQNRRRGTRWNCSNQFFPVGIAPSPVQFNDFLYFSVRDVSRTGLRVLTSLRNKFIVPGMNLDLQVSLPMTSQIFLQTRIARVGLTAENGKDYLEVGLEFVSLSDTNREVIGQYLIQFTDAESLNEIREQGFYPTSLSKGIDYYFIKSEAEFREVLELRLAANRRAGKIPDSYTADSMADIYDSRARIIVGKYRGSIVGTIRLSFTELGERLEHEKYVQLPEGFPRRDQILECARAATSPDFRKSDLWNSLIQHVAIAALQAKRSCVLMSTTAELVPTYIRIGFKDTGLRYVHPLYPEQEQIVMTIELSEVIMGIGVGPIYWNLVWRDVSKYIIESSVIDPTRLNSIRLTMYKLFSPVSVAFMILSNRPKKS